MKYSRPIFLALTLMSAAAAAGHASTLLDDTFADGSRNNQSLPTDAAWYVSSSSSWTTATNAMSVTMGTGAILGVSYFGTNSSSPVHLNIGDTLTVTVRFIFTNVAPANSSQGFRLGVFNFAESTLSPTWATADLSGNSTQGSGVQGYSLFQNCGVTFNNSSPMDIRVRTNLTSNSLLGTSGDHKSLATGPGNTNGFSGFANGTPYSLQLSLYRTNSTTLALTATWQNQTSGATLTTSVMDPGATTFNFDGIGFRPLSSGSTSTNITFTGVRVDLTGSATPPTITFQPQDQEVYTNQSASFSITADGSAPLSYQWYFNTNTLLTDATNAVFNLPNAQLSDAGTYSVIVANNSGSATSDVARLTVTIPTAPSIATEPQDQTVLPGGTVQFTVVAGGSEPLSYQWYFNTNTPLANANDSILTLTDVQTTNAGTYSVTVSNLAGSATSTNAILTVNTSPVAPTFISQPASQIAVAGSTVSFGAQAAGTAPISYQWNKNGSPIAGATATTLTLTNVQTTNAGSYTLTASNSVGSATSDPAVLTVTTTVSVPWSAYNLTGFGRATTGGGVIPETDSAYKKVYTALDFANAIRSANKTAGAVKVIEIMNDLDLGWNEVGTNVQSLDSNPFRAHTGTVKLHPRLLVTGVSLIDIKSKNGLTIFSANGATVRHATFNIKSTGNIVVRNLKFDELWEWDEASKGDYDKNDWDFIDLGNAGTVSNIWIDHCTFTKAYDGITDIKGGSFNITFSWCKYTGDDGASNTNSWVWQQINSLESNKTAYAMYNSLRTSSGFSTTDIVTIVQGHDKTHLMGANSLDAENAQLSATFHHQWFINPWDRLPRLRAGNVHCYNIYVDDTLAWAARQLRNQHTVSSTYNFNPPLNGSISTETGAVQVVKSVYLKCLWPLRDNQTDVTKSNYTGKIIALDTIYLNPTDNTLTRGNSTDPGSKLGPFQALAHVPFSWNLPGNQLPYTYTADDPAQLEAMVTSPTAGAGAGVLTWNKTNWLVTSYPASAPVIVADPQSQTVAPGGSVTFTVVASGSAPLGYQWYFNTNTPLANATNSSLILTNLQATNTGTYHVVVTNTAGSDASADALLTVSAGTPSRPQISEVDYSAGIFSFTVGGDPGPDYIVQVSTNLTDWTGVFTNQSATPPFVWADTGASNSLHRFYRIQLGP
jgi:pectate lyase